MHIQKGKKGRKDRWIIGQTLMARLAMEDHLGRELRSFECVHHVDGNTSNNNLNNLQVMSRSEHMKFHNPTRKYNVR